MVQFLLTFLLINAYAQDESIWIKPKDDRNWHSYSLIYNKKGLTSMRATWTVPKKPSVEGKQTISIWPGFETEDSNFILQPVLQWQRTSYPSWWISCYGVVNVSKSTNYSTKSSPKIAVEPGTELTGVMELVTNQGGLYTYKCYFEGYPDSELIYTTKTPLNSAWVDYETHKIENCSQYTEGSVRFKKIEVRAGGKRPLKIPWYKDARQIEDPLHCGMKVGIIKNSLIDGMIDIGIPVKAQPKAKERPAKPKPLRSLSEIIRT